MVASASPSFIAVLASLSEISIYHDGNIVFFCVFDVFIFVFYQSPSQSLNIKVEPSLIAVGVSLQNFFYNL